MVPAVGERKFRKSLTLINLGFQKHHRYCIKFYFSSKIIGVSWLNSYFFFFLMPRLNHYSSWFKIQENLFPFFVISLLACHSGPYFLLNVIFFWVQGYMLSKCWSSWGSSWDPHIKTEWRAARFCLLPTRDKQPWNSSQASPFPSHEPAVPTHSRLMISKNIITSVSGCTRCLERDRLEAHLPCFSLNVPEHSGLRHPLLCPAQDTTV